MKWKMPQFDLGVPRGYGPIRSGAFAQTAQMDPLQPMPPKHFGVYKDTPKRKIGF